MYFCKEYDVRYLTANRGNYPNVTVLEVATMYGWPADIDRNWPNRPDMYEVVMMGNRNLATRAYPQ